MHGLFVMTVFIIPAVFKWDKEIKINPCYTVFYGIFSTKSIPFRVKNALKINQKIRNYELLHFGLWPANAWWGQQIFIF